MTEAEELELLELEAAEAAAKTPAAKPPAPEPQTSRLGALAQGGLQGLTLGFSDEIAGGLGALGAKAMGDGRGWGELYRGLRDESRASAHQAETDRPGYYLAGNIAGGVAVPVPGGAAAAGAGTLAKLGRAALQTGGLGAAYGLGASEADTARGMAGDALLGGGLGVGAGGAGLALKGLGAAVKGAGQRLLTRAESKAAAAAADEAAAVTASARSKAGREAQGAYRQLENIRDTGALPSLEGVERETADALTAELAGKSASNLAPAVAAKEAAAAELAAAASSEGARAQALAAEKLKPTIGKDAMSFARSYGEPIVGGAVGTYLGDEVFDSPGVGGALGATIFGRTRAAKALMNRISKPGNQAALAKLLRAGGGAVERAPARAAATAGRSAAPHLSPRAASLLADLLRRRDEGETLAMEER